MANISVTSGALNLASGFPFAIKGTGQTVTGTFGSSQIVVQIPGGGTGTYHGSFFYFNGAILTHSTFDSYVHNTPTLSYSLSGVEVTAVTYFSFLDAGDGVGLRNHILFGPDSISGGPGGDWLYGYQGNDSIAGNGGNDTLDGGEGNDTMRGGLGNDTYVVDAAGDVVMELAGQGTDLVQVAFHYTLGSNLENLTLTGSSTISGTGNTLNNVITGNSANNVLSGGAGNDTLNGGAGTDRLIGGAGNDTYVIASAGDQVIETWTTTWVNLPANGAVPLFTISYSTDGHYLSGDGKLVLFESSQNDLVSGDSDNQMDVFLKNMETGGISRINYTAGGQLIDMLSGSQAASADLQEFAFITWHSLVTEDVTANSLDVYVMNTQTRSLTLASRDSSGNPVTHVSMHDVQISADGHYVAFSVREASNQSAHIYVKDLQTGDLELATSSSEGVKGVALTLNATDFAFSSDGKHVGFISHMTGLVEGDNDTSLDLYLKNLESGVTTRVSTSVPSFSDPIISGNGRFVGWTRDGESTLIDTQGANPGQVVNPDQVISESGGLPGYSADGRFKVYLFEGNLYVKDLISGNVALLNVNDAGVPFGEFNPNLRFTDVSDDGRFILLQTSDKDVVPGDTNENVDIFRLPNPLLSIDTGGVDTVRSAISYSLPLNLENLTLTGTAHINGTGNTLNNVLTGNSGNNQLNGSTGDDSMSGGAGNDTYIVDSVSDAVTEAAGAGVDTVRAAKTYTLSPNLENLVLLGVTAINATGNTLNNVLTGNSANNRLDGGSGNDAMAGGLGNDVYIVTAAGDVATEAVNAGTDTVWSSLSWTLGANLENLILGGSGAINGTGNTLNNVLTGNSGNNVLNGGAGNDSMAGGLGNDTYVVNAAGDAVTEGVSAGADTVQSSISYTLGANVERLTLTGAAHINATGNTLNNVLTGNSGNNQLNGSTGNDAMSGGAGNDTYIVDSALDTVTEAAGGGTDTVRAAATFTLGANLENLVLLGVTAINATGNTLNNVLTGNSAANRLDGGSGNDSMAGGLGNDLYVVTAAGDVVTEAVNAGTDTVWSSLSWTLAANLENLILGGSAAINGTGNTLNNVLTGNSGNNVLSAGGGADTLNGAAGNDTLFGGAGVDILMGGTGNDTLIWDPLDSALRGQDGTDTLRVDGAGVHMNLVAVPDSRISDIEVINLTGSGNNSLTLTSTDVLAISSTTNTLRVDGNSGDQVNFGTGWAQGANQTIGANTYRTLTKEGATLLVDSDIRVIRTNAAPTGDSVALTGNDLIDGLTQGGSWQFTGPRVLTYSLDKNFDGPIEPWTQNWIDAIDSAFNAWEALINVDFVRVGTPDAQAQNLSAADIAIALAPGEGEGAVAALGIFPDPQFADLLLSDLGYSRTGGEFPAPRPEGDITFDNLYSAFSSLDPGSTGYQILLHEIGHALGLKHANDDGGNGRPTFFQLGISDLNSPSHTVMGSDIDGPAAATPMLLDVLAIQHIYGANTGFNSGNNGYEIVAGMHRTIWDTGGIDAIDASISLGSVSINLNEGAFSTESSVDGSLAIAYNVQIENAVGSIGNDTILGNDAANNLSGGSGADILNGGGGDDLLDGGSGEDSLSGDVGNDVLVWDAADSTVDGGAGTDTLQIGGALALDGSGLAGTVIRDFEIIDIAAFSVTLSLTVQDVLDISSTSNMLRIDGDANDTVERGDGWTQGADQEIGANMYFTYTQGLATLLVDTDITVTV